MEFFLAVVLPLIGYAVVGSIIYSMIVIMLGLLIIKIVKVIKRTYSLKHIEGD